MDEPYARPDRAEVAARLGVADDSRYMTVAEFAALPARVHHAVWAAANEYRIGALAVTPGSDSTIYRYDRAQVLAIMAGLAGAEARRG